MPSTTNPLYLGFLKATLVHRHAFVPSLEKTLAIGRGARVPATFLEAVQGPHDPDLSAGLKRWYGRAQAAPARLQELLERHAADAGMRALERVAALRLGCWQAGFWLGMGHLRRCEFAAARARFDAVVAARPEWVWALLARSELARVDIEFAAALADLDEAARLEPENAWVWAFRSRVLFQQRPGPEGLTALDRAIELDPGSGWMRAWRGDARRKLGDFKGALSDLQAALELEPAYDRTYLWLGKTLSSLGRDAEALAILDRGLERCAFFEKAYAERSRVLARLGRVKEAIADLNEAARWNHRHDWLGTWTVTPFPPRPDQKKLFEQLDTYVAENPRDAWALAWRGESKAQFADLEGALSDLDRALALPKAPAYAYAWRGEAHVRLGKLAPALADLDRALKLAPEYARANAWRGRALLLQGRFDAALKDLDRAASDSLIEYSWIYYWKALAHAGAGRTEQARREQATALALEPDRAEFRSLSLGGAWERLETLGHRERLESVSAGFKLPYLPESELSYFRALFAPELSAALEETYAPGVNEADAFTRRGRIRRLQGDIGGAVQDLTRALDLRPGDAQALEWLGEADLGSPHAESTLTRAIEAGAVFAHLYRAALRLLRGRKAEARHDLDAFLLKVPGSALGLLLRGRYKDAARVSPGNSAAHLLAGDVATALDADPTLALISLSWYRPGKSTWKAHVEKLRRFALSKPHEVEWYYRQEEIRYSPYHFDEWEDARRIASDRPGSWSKALVGRGACRCPPDKDRAAQGLAALEAAVAAAPWSGWLYAWRALSWIQNGKPERALEDFGTALKLSPCYHRGYAWRGALLRKLGRHAEAASDLDRALAVDELYAFAWNERSLARRGLGDFAGAAADLDRAFLLDHRYSWVFTVGREPAPEELSARIVELEKAVEAEPGFPSLRVWLGQLKLQSGDLSAATLELLRAVQIDPHHALAQAWLGQALARAARYEQACDRYARALELEPRLSIAYGWLAEAEFRCGRRSEAFAALETVRKQRPTTSWIYEQRAALRLEAGERKAALRDAEKGLALEGRHADGWYVLARARFETGDAAGAEAAVERALTISPNHGRAFLLRTAVRERLGRHENVVADYRVALTRFPYLFNAEQKKRIEELVA